jgi:hypothetical protein
MPKTKENPHQQLIQFQETQRLSLSDHVETFFYENGFVILLTGLGLMMALTVWISCRF